MARNAQDVWSDWAECPNVTNVRVAKFYSGFRMGFF